MKHNYVNKDIVVNLTTIDGGEHIDDPVATEVWGGSVLFTGQSNGKLVSIEVKYTMKFQVMITKSVMNMTLTTRNLPG